MGAESISNVIGELPQIESTSLTFEWKDEFWSSKWRERINNNGVVTLVEATYWSRREEWRLYIYAVPSKYNVAAREYLLTNRLKELGELLRKASSQAGFFNHKIMFNLEDAKTS